MPLVIELPAEVEAMLRAEAAREGRPVEDLAADRLIARYERARAEAQAVLDGPFRPLDESFAALRQKQNLPDTSDCSPEELAARAEAVIAHMDPTQRDDLFEPEG